MHLANDHLGLESEIADTKQLSVLAWVRALQDHLVKQGYAASVPRQFSSEQVTLAYRSTVSLGDDRYAVECKLLDENCAVLRVSFTDVASNTLLLSYRVYLAPTQQEQLGTLSRKLDEARNRIPVIAQFLQQARESRTLVR